jgi:hypothetical protein
VNDRGSSWRTGVDYDSSPEDTSASRVVQRDVRAIYNSDGPGSVGSNTERAVSVGNDDLVTR